ncbi:MAG: GAF domain-containing protein [Deltaproteobacteria bacterium]|nr:GAF domain-containing protein [Deltaproteobacteria bacterium]
MLVSTVLNKFLNTDNLTSNIDAASNFDEQALTKTLQCASAPQQLGDNLQSLCALIANALEAYSVVIFLANEQEKSLTVGAYHSLSRDFIGQAKIRYGVGLVGWTAENKNRILVCPFEHDSSTLLYYDQDQSLKSFISLPILNEQGNLLGVIACDSKKNYAFAKVSEKILQDCAQQAATIIALHAKINSLQQQSVVNPDSLRLIIDQLRDKKDEDELMTVVADFPKDVVPFQAMVGLKLSPISAEQKVYSLQSEANQANHHLLEHVRKHKKVICSDKSIFFRPSDGKLAHTFLSVPFRVLDQEGGSLNFISSQHASFSAEHIAAVEQVARVLGHEIERVRLRQLHFDKAGPQGILSWSLFAERLEQALHEVIKQRKPIGLLRIDISKLGPLEERLGINATLALIGKISRIIEQIKLQDSPACRLYGNRFYLALSKADIPAFITRFETLVKKITAKDLGINEAIKSRLFSSTPGAQILQNIKIYTAYAPRDGETLADLCSRIETLAEEVSSQKTMEEVGNA